MACNLSLGRKIKRNVQNTDRNHIHIHCRKYSILYFYSVFITLKMFLLSPFSSIIIHQTERNFVKDTQNFKSNFNILCVIYYVTKLQVDPLCNSADTGHICKNYAKKISYNHNSTIYMQFHSEAIFQYKIYLKFCFGQVKIKIPISMRNSKL